MNVQKGKHQVGQPQGYHSAQSYSYAHGPYRKVNQHGHAENQGFHVNASAFPGQGAGVPGSGPGSQQMRGLQMHSGTSLPPPPQQPPHPQPPPTPTSTPPASDMGKPTQIQQSVNFVQNAQRAQGNPPYFATRMSPPANPRMQARPTMNVMNLNPMLPTMQYNGHIVPVQLPSHHHYLIGPAGTVPPMQNAQFSQQRQHNQAAAGQAFYQPTFHPMYSNLIQSSNNQYNIPAPSSHNLYVSSGNMGQYTQSVTLQRTGFTNANHGQMNMPPANVGPQPTMNMTHSQPIVNQQTTQQAPAQRSKTKRDKALAIIDPVTGKNVLDEINDDNGAVSNVTPPQSNDSSARETPQPGSSSHESDAHASSEQQQVRAEFAAMVAAAATDDVKQSPSPPSISEAVNGPENAETEINQSVPNSESVKISKLSSSHIDEYSSISQTSEIVKESTVHNAAPPPVHSHGQSMQTPVVSAITGEIQPNWQSNHAFPVLKNTNSPTVLISSPVKNSVRKQPRINSESDKSTIQEKIPQQIQSPPEPPQQVTQPIPPSPSVISNPVASPVDHTPTPPTVNAPAPVVTSAPAPTPVPVSAPVQKKEKNASNKTSQANAVKEDAPSVVTNQHTHPPPKERREKQRPAKEVPPQVQPPPQSVHVNVQSEPVPHKPSFSENSYNAKLASQIPSTAAPPTPVVQIAASVPASVTAPVPEEKSSPAVQQQQTNGETPVEPSDGKASQRQVQRKKPKMKVINKKGAEMEGSDMDAFTTETNQDEKEKPAPPAPATINNPSPVLSNKTSLVEKISKDELEEKIVAAKNEENTKVSALSKTEEDDSPAPIIEKSQLTSQPSITLKHKYKDDQWSPLNPEGKKKYEREFLLGLQSEPQSMKKPENLPNLEVVLHDHSNRRISSQPIYPSNRSGHDFVPNFLRSGQSLSRGQISNRKSQQGGSKGGGKGGSKTGGVMHISISLKDEVKLRETENAWRPARFNSAKELTEEARKTQDLFKKVRSILNKLTPQKFDTLVSQVKALPIDTSERLQGVINLVFDKAIDEPGFAKAYANMCKLVANMEVKDDKSNDGKGSVVFRKLLLARCQHEFESNKNAELDSEKRLQEIKACPDPEKKKELQLNYEEEERRIRRKSVGNIRFIGELYKLQMLTSGIMHRCIQHLLSKHEEESLECLCKLLTTIGKDLENAMNSAQSKEHQLPSLEHYFDKMSDLAQKRENSKISSRVRFMLQDVIELRQSKWVPRRDDNNPKTIDQIQRDADRESMEMSIALSAPRKQDMRGGDSDRKGRNRGSMNQDDKDGWQSVGGGKSFRPTNTYQYEPSRIQSFKQHVPETLTLGSSLQFNQWSRGANIKSSDKSDNRIVPTSNSYGLLSKERDGDKKHSNIVRSGGKITPSPSMEKERMISGVKEAMDSSDRQSHRIQQSSQPPSRDRTPTPARANTVSVPSAPVAALPPLTPEEIERKAKLIAEEYLCNNNCFEEAKQSIEELDRNVDDVLYEVLIFAINKSAPARASIGKLFADLIDAKFLSQSLVLSLYEKLCEQIVADEWTIDIPLIWDYFAEFVAPLVKADKFSFADLSVISKVVDGDHKGFFLPLIQFLSHECGENWVSSKWSSSRVQLTDFVKNPNDPNVQKVVEFLSRKGGDTSLPIEEVQKKLANFLQSDMDFDQIVDWINTHVGKDVKKPQFIRALMTAICECSISSNKKLLEPLFRKHEKLIRRYIDQIDEELEVQCLYAIQAYTKKLEHPSGLLMSIFTYLWENGVISNDAFVKWRDIDSVEEGKGVAVKSLTSFFTVLNEAEMSDDAS